MVTRDGRVPLISIHGVNCDQHLAALLMESAAAPRPMFGIIDESALQRIGLHVAELFEFLLATPNMEVVEALLPKLRQAEFHQPSELERKSARLKFEACGTHMNLRREI